MEFINASIEYNKLDTEFHSQACYTSRILNFTSKELNEILESDMSTGITKDLEDCVIKDMK
jgi:hypothetical protein